MRKSLIPSIIVFLVIAVSFSCETSSSLTEQDHEVVVQSISEVNTSGDVMFDGHSDHYITQELATAMMSSFRDKNPNKPYGWFFGKTALEKLLAQDGVVGLRIYGGLSNKGHFSPVLYGVRSNGSDIRPAGALAKSQAADSSDGIVILELAAPCPPYCGGGG